MPRSMRLLIPVVIAALCLVATLGGADAAWKWRGSYGENAVSMLIIGDIDIQLRSDPTTAFAHIGETMKKADLVYANLEGMLVTPQGPEVDIPDKRGWRHPGPDGVRALTAWNVQVVGVANNVAYDRHNIMETLRVRPVVALVDRHVRQAVGIGGHTIPAGVIACPNIYLVQRRADLYQDPAAFRPDRFVGQTPPAFGWFPFGGGIRRCLGASFATFEMRIVIPEVLSAVTLRPASRRPARVRREAVTFVPHDGTRCIVTLGCTTPRRMPSRMSAMVWSI